MLEFIWKNKEWLFSGAGVALIVLLFRIVRSIIDANTKQRQLHEAEVAHPINEVRSKSRSKETRRQTINNPPPLPLQTSSHFPLNNILTPQSLIKIVNEAPLLQQSQIAANYKGVTVTWEGRLEAANERAGNHIQLHMSCGPPQSQVLVALDVAPQQNPSLSLLKKGDKVLVTGQIQDIRPSYIHLRQVSVTKVY